MTVVKSNIITDADDSTIISQSGNYAAEKVVIAEYTAAGALADNTVTLLAEIPVDAKITSIRFWSDDLGTTGAFNVGLYPGKGSNITIADDTDAIDEDCIATAVDVNAAAVADSELRFEVANITTASHKAWELAGLSSRPDYGTFYLALTNSAATTAGGDIAAIIRFTQ